jgi:magnesium-protoporphyrin O-methyltransferase
MAASNYLQRRGELEHYFDRTAVKAWARLTSDEPVSRIRASVRAGRDQMRAAILQMLPLNLHGRRILDAGCGTGTMARELWRRGARVVAIDLSLNLVQLARGRSGTEPENDDIRFLAGDMTDPSLGMFDHIVAMDSLIHYRASDVLQVLARLTARCQRSLLFTFAPSTPLLAVMHGVGRLFPRSDRAPAIEPMPETRLRRLLATDTALEGWELGRSERIAHGFYTSQALELVRA